MHWASQPQLSEAARLFYEREVERKNEVYAPDLIIESSLKQLAQWYTDIFGIEEMTISKISEEEIQKPEEKLTLHRTLDSMVQTQQAAQTNIILQEQIEPPMRQKPCARRDQKEDWA